MGYSLYSVSEAAELLEQKYETVRYAVNKGVVEAIQSDGGANKLLTSDHITELREYFQALAEMKARWAKKDTPIDAAHKGEMKAFNARIVEQIAKENTEFKLEQMKQENTELKAKIAERLKTKEGK